MSAAHNQLNVLHVTPTFYPATYWGGPIHSLYGLCNDLVKNANVSLRVLTTDAAGPRRRDRVRVTGFPMLYPGGYEVYFCSGWFALLLFRLWPMVRWATVVHLTAVYSPSTIPTLVVCRLLGKPVVWSPQGSLQRWDYSTRRWSKAVWETLCRLLITRNNCVLHVTSEKEAADSLSRMPRLETAVIPNGVEAPQHLPTRDWQPEGRLRLLYLGRLHPIKGMENLIRALKLLDDSKVSLSIYGNGNARYCAALAKLVKDLGLEGQASFHGHVEGNAKRDAFRQADLCVVPSFSENFCMVVAEALAHAVPVIACRGTPWQDLEKHGCGMWVDNGPQSLAFAISDIRTEPLEAMGMLGRAWMKEEFDSSFVARRMMDLYYRLWTKKSTH